MRETMITIPERIVAEMNKTWPQTQPQLLSEMFESVIAENRRRGFALESWQLNGLSTVGGQGISETIVAVFVKVDLSKE